MNFTLDYTIRGAEERNQFVQALLAQEEKFLTDEDYDQITNYLMCGIGEDEIKSPVQLKEVYLEGKNSPKRKSEESLEALLETPSFNESAQIASQGITYKIPKPNFTKDRETIIKKGFKGVFEDLWERIEQLDRLVAIRKGEEVTPPPSPEELRTSEKLTPRRLAQLRQLIIELRREQYTLKDQVLPELQRHELLQEVYRGGEQEKGFNWDWGYCEVLPLGLYSDKSDAFQKPYALTSQSLPSPSNSPLSINFCDPIHIYHLIENREKLEEGSIGDCESQIPIIYQTLDYYTQKAYFSEKQLDLLKLKTLHYPNSFIMRQLNQKYEMKYSESYISTIYTKQICEGIAAAAQLHYDTYVERGKSERFKKCKDCGQVLLLDERNFPRMGRNKDGFMCRCKRCDKKRREEKNQKNQENE